MKKRNGSNLIKDVVINYICMIVIPVMLVLCLAFLLASNYIYQASTNSVKMAQEAILDLHQEELRDAAISLSHIINHDNGLIVKQAASGTDRQMQKEALSKLNMMYQLLAAPEYKLLDVQIYNKDDSMVTPRWVLRYSLEQLRGKNWYKEVLKQPGQIYKGVVHEDYFYRIRSTQEMLVIAAAAPKDMPDIECVAVYKRSEIPEIVRRYNKDKSMGKFMIVNSAGVSILEQNTSDIVPQQVVDRIKTVGKTELQFLVQKNRYIIKAIPESDLFIVTEVDSDKIFGQFRIFSAVCLDQMQGPILWNPDIPYLYTVEIRLKNRDFVLDSHSCRTGFRTIECTSKGLFVNGKQIKIVGLNRHQSFPYVGYAMGKRAQEKDAEILKDFIHVNVVRTSHYMQSEYFLDRCDEIGLLVFSEISGWGHIGGEEFKKVMMLDIESMILDQFNHPSIFIWSIHINESLDDDELYCKANALAKELDSSRPTTGVRYIANSHLLEDVYSLNDFTYSDCNPDGTKLFKGQQEATGLDDQVPFLISEFSGTAFPVKSWDSADKRIVHARAYARACLKNALQEKRNKYC